MAQPKQHKLAYKLLDLFNTLYQNKYARKYNGNAHSDKWGFIDMINDLTYEGAERVVRYYFKTTPRGGHSRQHLIYHYHEYHQAIENQRTENAKKRKILERMREQYEGRD